MSAAALLLMGMAAGPAQAADYYESCATNGASGSIATSGWSAGGRSVPSLVMKIYDDKPDGHHVRIRAIASHADTKTYYSWHKNTDGWGTYRTIDTYIPSGAQIYSVGVQVATFEGDTLLYSCTRWV
ncbi:hypothetical protein ABZY20_16580 [Streptomyces sp. NPDC006624]|uniref:hypothetical protein n=1 Tax=Streptomyces sp. NPDC006624 TaxID=3154892 RepID=UPI0033BDDD2E